MPHTEPQTEPRRRRLRKRSAATVALAIAVTTGCAPTGAPMIADHAPANTGTLADHLAWLEAEFDRAIAAADAGDGWFVPFGADQRAWSDDWDARADILGSIMPRSCGSGGRIARGAVLRDAPDPLAAALRVRDAWVRAGWEITDLAAPPRRDYANFRADRDDGAVLGFDANADGLILEAHSACSTDPTMTLPMADLTARDAFIAEIRARDVK